MKKTITSVAILIGISILLLSEVGVAISETNMDFTEADQILFDSDLVVVNSSGASINFFENTKSNNHDAGEYNRILDSPTLEFSNGITWSGWIKAGDQNRVTIIASVWDTSKLSWRIGTDSTEEEIQVLLSEGGVSISKYYETNSLSPFDNEWHHLAFTWEVDALKIYCDGEEVTAVTKITDLAMSSINQPATNVLFGTFHGSGIPQGNTLFKGKFDEISLWNASLSAVEIAELYNSGFPDDLMLHSNLDSLVGWWRMGDEDSFPTIPDLINGNNANTQGMESADILGDTIRDKNYYSNNAIIEVKESIEFERLLSLTENSTITTGNDIKYQVSIDNGTTWQWWNGTDWDESDNSLEQSNSVADINDNLLSITRLDGTFRIQSHLIGNNISSPLLTSLRLGYYSAIDLDALTIPTIVLALSLVYVTYASIKLRKINKR